MERQTTIRTPAPRQRGDAAALPHERDEASDGAGAPSATQGAPDDARIAQAAADLAAGQTDTDCRGTPGVEALQAPGNEAAGAAPAKPWCAAPGHPAAPMPPADMALPTPAEIVPPQPPDAPAAGSLVPPPARR